MTAVAERATEYDKQSTLKSDRAARLQNPRRRAKTKKSRYARWLVGIVIGMFVFAYVAYYAMILVQERRYTEVCEMKRQEQIKVERLNVHLNTQKSPEKIISAASRHGMVYGKEYDYVGRAGRVASSTR